jgi:hypothetical protein
MIRGPHGEPDDMTEEYFRWLEQQYEEVTVSISCKHKEQNEHGVLVERCLRDASFVVDGKSYCHSHVSDARTEKKEQEKKKGGGVRIANQTHYKGWTAKLQRVWRKDDDSKGIITIVEDLMVPDEFTIHVRGKQYAHVAPPADMDSAIEVAELGYTAWGLGPTKGTDKEVRESLKKLLGIYPEETNEDRERERQYYSKEEVDEDEREWIRRNKEEVGEDEQDKNMSDSEEGKTPVSIRGENKVENEDDEVQEETCRKWK